MSPRAARASRLLSTQPGGGPGERGGADGSGASTSSESGLETSMSEFDSSCVFESTLTVGEGDTGREGVVDVAASETRGGESLRSKAAFVGAGGGGGGGGSVDSKGPALRCFWMSYHGGLLDLANFALGPLQLAAKSDVAVEKRLDLEVRLLSWEFGGLSSERLIKWATRRSSPSNLGGIFRAVGGGEGIGAVETGIAECEECDVSVSSEPDGT